jgi:hypothetical protein
MSIKIEKQLEPISDITCPSPPTSWVIPLSFFDMVSGKPLIPITIDPNVMAIVPEFRGETMLYRLYCKHYYDWMKDSTELVGNIKGQWFGVEQNEDGSFSKSLRPLMFDKHHWCLMCEHVD